MNLSETHTAYSDFDSYYDDLKSPLHSSVPASHHHHHHHQRHKLLSKLKSASNGMQNSEPSSFNASAASEHPRKSPSLHVPFTLGGLTECEPGASDMTMAYQMASAALHRDQDVLRHSSTDNILACLDPNIGAIGGGSYDISDNVTANIAGGSNGQDTHPATSHGCSSTPSVYSSSQTRLPLDDVALMNELTTLSMPQHISQPPLLDLNNTYQDPSDEYMESYLVTPESPNAQYGSTGSGQPPSSQHSNGNQSSGASSTNGSNPLEASSLFYNDELFGIMEPGTAPYRQLGTLDFSSSSTLYENQSQSQPQLYGQANLYSQSCPSQQVSTGPGAPIEPSLKQESERETKPNNKRKPSPRTSSSRTASSAVPPMGVLSPAHRSHYASPGGAILKLERTEKVFKPSYSEGNTDARFAMINLRRKGAWQRKPSTSN